MYRVRSLDVHAVTAGCLRARLTTRRRCRRLLHGPWHAAWTNPRPAQHPTEETMSTSDGTLRSRIETLLRAQVQALTGSSEFRALEDGSATTAQYDAFIENVARAHLRSPQL